MFGITVNSGMFSLSNPLHTDVFPNVRRYEAEVIRMTIDMLNGGPEVCGAMTSGGTERYVHYYLEFGLIL